MTQSKKKQSIIVGALTGTAGIFFTKALGLIYASPLSAMAGQDLVFYGRTYQMYDFLLSISLSGIPFAIATLVAKYVEKEDYESALLVRKIALPILSAICITLFTLVVLFSGNIAYFLAPDRDSIYWHKLQMSLIIIAFAVITVPILSMFRGFYQGLKEMKVYAFSQVLEQIVRVSFLLGMGALLVYGFNQAGIWAVYFAIASSSVSALVCIFYFLFLDRRHLPEIRELASKQEKTNSTRGSVFREMMYIAIPFLAISIISNCGGMINSYYVIPSLQGFGYSNEMADTIYSIISFNVYKLVTIPQILGPGFAIAIIPHISAALAVKNYETIRLNIKKVLTSCSYLIYPIILLMGLFAPEVYFVMYGADNLQLGANILQWYLLLSSFWIIMVLCSNTLMALELKRVNLIWNIVDVATLLLFIRTVTSNFSYPGLFLLYSAIYLGFIILGLFIIKRRFDLKLLPIFKTMLKSSVCLIVVFLVYYLSRFIPVDAMANGRIFTFIWLAIVSLLAIAAYLVVTYLLKLPQEIFDFDLSKLRKGK